MPFVRISFKQSTEPAYRRAVGDSVHAALVATGVPAQDHFQVLSGDGEDLVYDPSYLGIERSDGIVIIQIFLGAGRTLEKKRAIYREIVDRLVRDHGIRAQDVFINLIETGLENWSFGNGQAQYVDTPPAHLTQAPSQ